MNYITLSEFLADTESVIDATIDVEELTNISTERKCRVDIRKYICIFDANDSKSETYL